MWSDSILHGCEMKVNHFFFSSQSVYSSFFALDTITQSTLNVSIAKVNEFMTSICITNIEMQSFSWINPFFIKTVEIHVRIEPLFELNAIFSFENFTPRKIFTSILISIFFVHCIFWTLWRNLHQVLPKAPQKSWKVSVDSKIKKHLSIQPT